MCYFSLSTLANQKQEYQTKQETYYLSSLEAWYALDCINLSRRYSSVDRATIPDWLSLQTSKLVTTATDDAATWKWTGWSRLLTFKMLSAIFALLAANDHISKEGRERRGIGIVRIRVYYRESERYVTFFLFLSSWQNNYFSTKKNNYLTCFFLFFCYN